jgi:DNA repair protein RadC
MSDDAAPMRDLPAIPRMKDIPNPLRPRERLAKEGADKCENAALLAILLRTGTKGRNVMQVAQEMLARFGSLEHLARASLEQLRQSPGVGPDKAVTLQAAFQLAQRIARERRGLEPPMDNPSQVADLLRDEFASLSTEQLHILLLNTRRRLIRVVKSSQGTQDAVMAHPREVFRDAIAANAAAIILAHNHPSGDPHPSEADIKITRDLIRAGQLLKIEVVDHIIVGRLRDGEPKDYLSLREQGFFHT